jgi:Cdc6-like AAA superfamily ATPase
MKRNARNSINDFSEKKRKLNNKKEEKIIELNGTINYKTKNELFYDLSPEEESDDSSYEEERNEGIKTITNNFSKNLTLKSNPPSTKKIKTKIIKKINTEEENEEYDQNNFQDYYLPCREKEQITIYDYIRNGLDTLGSYSCLYISGMPGTGKTACVNAMINKLKHQSMNSIVKVPTFDFFYLNGMKVANPNNVFKLIYEHLFSDGRSTNLNKCISSLDNFFKNRKDCNYAMNLNINNQHLVLVIDEIDCLITKKQALLYNIFNWTTYAHSKLIIISISNTLDLPEKLQPKIRSRMGNNRLIFKPYGRDELLKIIEVKVQNIGLFSKDAQRFSAMKVSAINGDLRRVLQICRRAKEIWEREGQKDSQIGINHIKKACEDLFDSKVIKLIKNLKTYEKTVLLSIVYSMKIINNNRAPVTDIYKYQCYICHKTNKQPMNFDEFKSVVYNLIKLKIFNFVDTNSENFITNSIFIKFYTDELANSFEDGDPLKALINEFQLNA